MTDAKAELVGYCLESGVARVWRPNATESDLGLGYVNKNPFPYSSINDSAPCFGKTYWDTRSLVSHVDGSKLAVDMAEEEIGKKVDWSMADFISTETTAGVPFATWLANKRKLPLVVVVDEPMPYNKEATGLYHNLSKRNMKLNIYLYEVKKYDFVATGTLEGLAFAAWFAQAANKPMFYIREEPKTYGKSRESKIGSQVEGLGNYKKVKGKKVFNVDEHLGIQPPHVKKLLSLMEADVGEKRRIWGPENPDELRGKYGIHFTDLMTSGRNARNAILAMREVGAKIEYCHFVIKRGNKDLAKDNIEIGWDLHENEIIEIAAEEGLFTKEDVDQINEFNAGPRKFNEKFLRTEAGKEWIKSLGKRGKRIIVEGYPHLTEEYKDIIGL